MCSHIIGGQYFTSSQAMKPIKTNGKVYQPHIIPIDNKLYTSTIAYDRKHPKQSLWYSNDYLYRIGAEDVLRITVWDHPELNDPSTNTPINYNPAGSTATNPLSNRGSSNPIGTTVDAEGNIYYPFAGQVHLAGLTPRAASVVLSKKLLVRFAIRKCPLTSLIIAANEFKSSAPLVAHRRFLSLTCHSPFWMPSRKPEAYKVMHKPPPFSLSEAPAVSQVVSIECPVAK